MLSISFLTAVFAALGLAVWFSLIIWTYHDIRLRSHDLFTQLMAIWPLTLPPAALSWNVARPELPLTLSEMCSTELPKVIVPLPFTEAAIEARATVRNDARNMTCS